MTATRGRTAAAAGAGILITNEVVNLNNVDITFCTSAGHNGGGIAVTGAANLSLNNTRIIGNFAAANGGGIDGGVGNSSITATDSTFAGNITGGRGAALGYAGASHSITLIRSTLSGNTGGTGGGAIYQQGGTLVVESSTISKNTDISAGAFGGGAFIITANVNAITIRNSTFKDNVSVAGPGGAINLASGSASTTQTTINLFNSVFSGNSSPIAPDISTATLPAGIAPTKVNAAYSAVSSTAGIGNWIPDATSAALVGVDAQLSALGGNGGPTLSNRPAPTSPILDQGSSTATIDQRSQVRPFDISTIANGAGGAFDIGSVELNPDIPVVSQLTVADITTGGGATQSFTVQFSDDIGMDTATFDNFDIRVTGPRGYNQLATKTAVIGGPSPVDVTYEISAPGGSWDIFDSGLYVLNLESSQVKDGGATSALGGVLGSFLVFIPGTLKVDNTADIDDGNYGPGQLTLREAVAISTAVFSDDTITFDPAVFSTPQTITMNGTEMMIGDRVTVTGPGSGLLTIDAQQKSRIFNIDQAGSASNTFTISGMTLKNGLVTGNGGAILNSDETLIFSDMKFLNNKATAIGGALHNTAKVSVTVTNAVFSDNTAGTGQGGGIAFATAASTGNFTNVTFLRNTSGIQGGGVAFAGNSTSTFDSVTFDQNIGSTGGALFMSSTLSFTATNSKFINNTSRAAGGGGGAIRFGAGSINISQCLFDNNTAGDLGGAICSTTGPFTYSIGDSTFTNNTALTSVGGAIASNANGTTMNVFNTIFDHNSATSGGAVYAITTLNLGFTNSTFTYNDARTSGGGALRAGGGAITVDSCTFDGNTSSDYGGAFGFTTGPHNVNINNSTLVNNWTNGHGGAIGIETGTGGVVALNSTTVANNTAATGGGVFLTTSNSLMLNSSTLTGNRATANDSAGGAIALYQGSATITNSTISGNLTQGLGGGGLALLAPLWNGTIDIQNSTIANNSAPNGIGGGIGGISNLGTVTLTSTIVATNTASTGRDIGFILPRTVAGDNNLIGWIDPADITLSGTNNPALIGSGTITVDPGLYPLAYNGGPTQTHALRTTSKALDQGSNATLQPADQRGGTFTRTLDDGAITNAVDGTDIGAIEGTLVAPIADPMTLVNVPPTGADYIVTVVYEDDIGVDTVTVDKTDLQMTGPGFGSPATPFKVVVSGPATKLKAEYYFTPPGGGWDASDNGVYSVSLVGTVQDLDSTPQTVNKSSLGSFLVGITQTFKVDTVVDEDDGNYSAGDLSLREAIRLANQSTRSVDNIVFDNTIFNTPKTISLSLGQLLITDSVNLAGPGASLLTISGNQVTRVFECLGNGLQINVTISGMTITEGRTIIGKTAGSTLGDGGGIEINGENVTLDSVVVSNNVSAGEAGGVGVGTFGTLVVRNSTISGNSAVGFGGGIYFQDEGSLIVENSTISGNVTNGQGGAIYFYANEENGLVIRNSTISGNIAGTIGGGISVYAFVGTLTIQNSTITGNNAGTLGGGIGRTSSGGYYAKFNFANSIIAGNTIGGAPIAKADLSTDVATNAFTDFSFIGIQDAANNVTIAGSGNQTGTVAAPIDPMLGPLANNGGSTLTHAPLPGSPVIDQGKNFNGSKDQRGITRPQDFASIANAAGGDGSDIGAVEIVAALPPTVTKIAINNGDLQRSMVTTIKVTFSEAVMFPMGLAAAFDVSRYAKATPNGSGLLGSVSLDLVQMGSDVVITFKSGGTVGIDMAGSLEDGQYKLTIFADKILGAGGTLDGDGDTIAEGNPADNKTQDFHRLFGDGNGDGNVTSTDFALFRSFFGIAGPLFDWDGNGNVNGTDFAEFRKRFGLGGYLP